MPPEPSSSNVAAVVSEMIRARCISCAQYQQLSDLIMADGTIDEQERRQVNRLFDAIRSGRVKITD